MNFDLEDEFDEWVPDSRMMFSLTVGQKQVSRGVLVKQLYTNSSFRICHICLFKGLHVIRCDNLRDAIAVVKFLRSKSIPANPIHPNMIPAKAPGMEIRETEEETPRKWYKITINNLPKDADTAMVAHLVAGSVPDKIQIIPGGGHTCSGIVYFYLEDDGMRQFRELQGVTFRGYKIDLDFDEVFPNDTFARTVESVQTYLCRKQTDLDDEAEAANANIQERYIST